jgi:hypothetical protein
MMVLLFSISGNISAKASSNKYDKVQDQYLTNMVQEPKGCLKSEGFVCGVKTQGLAQSFQLQSLTFHLAPKTIVIRTSPGHWYLSQGEVWVESVEPVTLRTQFGKVLSEGTLSVLVSSAESSVEVVPLAEDCVIVPMGSETPYSLDVGLLARLEGRDKRGFGYLRIPQSAPVAKVMQTWAQLHKGAASEFARMMKQYRIKWGVQASLISEAHKDIYKREVASAKERERIQRERRQRYEAESQQLRQMFKNKNYH